MTRISAFCLVCSTLALFAWSAQGASPGPAAGARPPAPKIPQIHHPGRPVAADQQLSFWGVQTVIERKRDRLHRARGRSKTH